MMDKRTLLAFVLIALILILTRPFYEMLGLAPSPGEPDVPTERVTPGTISPGLPSEKATRVMPPQEKGSPLPGLEATFDDQLITVETPLYLATVSSRGGGTFESFRLKDYLTHQGTPVDLLRNRSGSDNLLISLTHVSGNTVSLEHPFQMITDVIPGDTLSVTWESQTLTFRSELEAGEVTKSLTFHPDSYVIDVSMDLSAVSRSTVSQERFLLTWDQGLPITESNAVEDVREFAGFLYQGGERIKKKHKKDDPQEVFAPGRTDWTSIRSKYFTAAFIPRDESHLGQILAYPYDPGDLNPPPAPRYRMAVGFSSRHPVTCSLYLGPLKYSRIKRLKVDLEETMSFGWVLFRPFSKGVLLLLTGMHKFVPNYGILLIVVSILVKIVVYPLTRKSYHSTKEMQAIQPLIADLRVKHKGDPQRLNRATMNLYKEHGVNPLGGCLPMLLQMPLLIALFIVFRTTIELRAAPFVWWIKDLSAPDALIPLGTPLPILGWDQISLLPLLMGASMFVQQRMMGTPAAAQQKLMSYFMTGFFILIFNSFPSGLNLYYTLFNVLTILQQKYLTHPPKPTPVPSPSKKKR
ncbi:MAG: membrane protein insertase YidC [Fidelibacterota bacterium]